MDLIVDNGKPLEPSSAKKAIAALKRDKALVVTLPSEDINRIVCDHLWSGSTWLGKYKFATVKPSEDGLSYSITFTVESL